MPENIARFERLAYLAVLLSALSAALNWPTISKFVAQSPVIYPIAIAAIFAVQVAFIWLIARKRKNWARWTLLILIVWGSGASLFDLETRFNNGVPAAIAYYLAYLIWIPAIYFLFAPGSGAWFRALQPEVKP